MFCSDVLFGCSLNAVQRSVNGVRCSAMLPSVFCSAPKLRQFCIGEPFDASTRRRVDASTHVSFKVLFGTVCFVRRFVQAACFVRR